MMLAPLDASQMLKANARTASGHPLNAVDGSAKMTIAAINLA
jgi:hypothetical protein